MSEETKLSGGWVAAGIVAMVVGAAAIYAVSARGGAEKQVAAAAGATTAATTTRAPAPPNVMSDKTVAKLDVQYAAHDPELNRLDVYAPRDAKGAATLLFVHGGEWSRGDKQPVSYKPKFFNDNGVIFITTNYRLSPKAVHPAQVDDVAEAIAWVRDHVAEYGGDAKKIVVLGHSAGCHLVTYVGLNPAPLAKVGMKPTDLAGVVAWSGGMYDLVARHKEGGMYKPFIEATFGTDAAAQRAGSPMTYASNVGKEPAFLIASTDETKKTSSQAASQEMMEKINGAGGSAEGMVLAGRTHREAIEQLGAPDDKTGPALLAFIRKVTK